MQFLSLTRWIGPLLLWVCLFQSGLAQTRQPLHCGTPDFTPEQSRAFAKHIQQAELRRKQSRQTTATVTFLGIKPWVVKGGTFWPPNIIVNYINKLNEDFVKTNIQFYIVSGGVGTITATNSRTLTYPNDETNLLTTNFDATAINVYFADGLNYCGSDGTCKGVGGFSPSLLDLNTLTDRPTDIANPNVQPKKDDYILVGSAYSDVLSHEMGHYFGLLHTFNGSAATNCNDRERPGFGDTDRGDLIADTDADPFPLFTTSPFNQTTCAYSSTLVHCATNQRFNPPVNNTMSYWDSDLCPKYFTANQLSRIPLFLSPRQDSRNQYQLQNGVPGVATGPVITGKMTGTDLSERAISWSAAFGGTPVTGALGYIVERSTTSDFNTYIISYSTENPSSNGVSESGPLPPGGIYYYRVRASNGKAYSNTVALPCNAPTATLSGSQTVTNGQSATFTVALTGTAPWNVQVGGSTYSNVTSSPLSIVTPPYPALQQTYTQTTSGGSVTNTCGTAPMSGTASVTVIGTCPTVSVTLTYGSIGCGQTTASGSILTSPSGYAPHWRNVTTGTDYPGAGTFASNLAAGDYTIDLLGPNGCPGPQQRLTIRDYGPNGSTATLSGPANNRISKGQQTAIRVDLTGTSPWSVTYTGRGGQQLVAGNISTASYDLTVLPDSTTTYRLLAVSGQCNASAVNGSATLLVVPVLASLEYFVDTDPGIGQATPLSVGFNQTTTTQTIGIPLQSRPAGVYTLGFRAKDGNGYWSATTLKPFVAFGQVPALNTKSISLVEYTIDGQPPVSVPVSVSNGEGIALPISLSLTDGVHILATRVLDNGSNWSGYATRPFVVFGAGGNAGQTITQAEYYIDTDPGVGAATQLAYNPTPGAPLSLSINPSSLSPGVHTLLVRTKDSRNRWSASYVRSFLVAPVAGTISRIEYFYDTPDPGLGSASSLAFSPPNSGTVTAQQGIGVGNLTTGTHTITARAQTTQGVWSTTKAASFSVTSCFQALAQLIGSYTATAGQPVSVSVGFGGSSPWSLTANGQVFTNIVTPSVSFTVQYPNSGSYAVNAQTAGISVANSCGAGVVSGTATVAVTGSCTSMYTLKSGNWNDPAVWSCGRLPTSTDVVEIRHGIQIPANYVALVNKLIYKARVGLNFGTSARLKLN